LQIRTTSGEKALEETEVGLQCLRPGLEPAPLLRQSGVGGALDLQQMLGGNGDLPRAFMVGVQERDSIR